MLETDVSTSTKSWMLMSMLKVVLNVAVQSDNKMQMFRLFCVLMKQTSALNTGDDVRPQMLNSECFIETKLS